MWSMGRRSPARRARIDGGRRPLAFRRGGVPDGEVHQGAAYRAQLGQPARGGGGDLRGVRGVDGSVLVPERAGGAPAGLPGRGTGGRRVTQRAAKAHTRAGLGPRPTDPVQGSDGRTHLVYELELTNFTPSDLTIDRVDVLDVASGEHVQTYGARAVRDRMQTAGVRESSAGWAPRRWQPCSCTSRSHPGRRFPST